MDLYLLPAIFLELVGNCSGSHTTPGTHIYHTVVVFFFLYESSSLSLEAVDVMYNDPNVKPWTSRSWEPPADYGYSGRSDLVDQTRAQEENKPVVGHLEKAPGEADASGSGSRSSADERSVDAMVNNGPNKV
jgi:hypothetical protein